MTLRSLSGRAKAALGASLLLLATAGCDEEGKTAPEKCGTPALEIFDIANPPDDRSDGAGGDGNPCVTPIGHALSPSAGTGGTGNGSTSSDAGAGGA